MGTLGEEFCCVCRVVIRGNDNHHCSPEDEKKADRETVTERDADLPRPVGQRIAEGFFLLSLSGE